MFLQRIVERAAARPERAPDSVLIDGDGGILTGRPVALERAVRNLLDNAAKFDPTGYPIEVTIRGGHVEVRDRGPGIGAGDVAHVFDRFYRSDAARNQPGSGLGLAIVADIAAAHGWPCFAFNTPKAARRRLRPRCRSGGSDASPAASDGGRWRLTSSRSSRGYHYAYVARRPRLRRPRQVFSADAKLHTSGGTVMSRGPVQRNVVQPSCPTRRHASHVDNTSVTSTATTPLLGVLPGTAVKRRWPGLQCVMAGWVDDEFERRAEGWRIVERRWHSAWSSGNPAVLGR